MKKGYLMLLFMALIFIFPFNVYALTGNVKISCPEHVTDTGSNVVCTIKGTSDDIVMGLTFKISVSGGGSVVKFTKTSNIWHDASYTNGQVDAYAEDTNISGNFDIGDVTVKLPEGVYGIVTVTINSVTFGDANYNDISVGITGSKVDISIEKKEDPSSYVTPVKPSSEDKEKTEPKTTDSDDSSNNQVGNIYLDNILVEGYDLNFSKDVYDYVLNIKNETSLNITPVVEDEMADYSISGNENLENGSVISIKVTLSDKEKVYTIKVQKNNIVDKKQGIDYVKIAFAVIIGILVFINLFRLLSRSKRRENNQ